MAETRIKDAPPLEAQLRALNNPKGALPWHVVRRVGGTDGQALAWLARMRLETYYPLVREMKPVARNKLSQKQRANGNVILRPTLSPFFPGYIFVRMELEGMDWRSIKDIAGIGGLACEGGLPIRLPNALIDAIRVREVGGAVPGKTPAKLIFQVGQAVRVTEGPFASFAGLVERLPHVSIGDIDSETRIRVALEMFGRATPVDLPVAYIEKK